jgi:triacylglycerol esterase/lipase EstA (alpha/beta hydrolase family)
MTWRNDYPIVLVHGFFGFAPDMSPLANYFHYALQKNVVKRGFSYRQNCYFKDVYTAHVSPLGGVHDRACELYQQLVGIEGIRHKCGFTSDYVGPGLVKAVYGPDHAFEEHSKQDMYKPRYLRQLRGGQSSQQVFAFPDGLPGGWNSQRRVHIVAHSQGAMVVRYLQYLLSIDYFAYMEQPQRFLKFERPGRALTKSQQPIDRSNYIASITTLNGCMNGGPGSYYLDADEETLHFHESGPKATRISRGWVLLMKLWIVAQNLLSPSLTMSEPQENVRKKIKVITNGVKNTIL